jgi:arginyl-tRNA synthetase
MKKISINEIRTLPSDMGFGFCVYGTPDENVTEWAKSWGFKIEPGKPYTNILVPKNFDISECFEKFSQYKYVDGFSPNLNKHLHVGHMSNFILAKTFQSMEIGENFISILGDTLDGDVTKHDAYNMYETYCSAFGLDVSEVFYASDMKYNGGLLKKGEGKYEGTEVFDTGEEKIVGIKSDGSTSYFYQDMALAEKLNAPTLYLTGHEQDGHFGTLKKFHPDTNHIGLGLVTVTGAKMSSREGNVIYFSDLIEDCLEQFGNDWDLAYNVLAGFIIKIDPKKDKKINMKMLKNPKNSPGLYLSYTLARLTSAGVRGMKIDKFNSTKLQFDYMKSLINIQPNILFNGLAEHCKLINNLYGKHKIEGNPENEVMFSTLKEDLEFGMKKLGLFLVDKV